MSSPPLSPIPIHDKEGETQLVGSSDSNVPINPIDEKPRLPIQYSINSSIDLEIVHEDDDMLEMQIRLGEVQENNLKRLIEHKRRRMAQSSSQSHSSIQAPAFDLSRELSMEIERDRSSKTQALKIENQKL